MRTKVQVLHYLLYSVTDFVLFLHKVIWYRVTFVVAKWAHAFVVRIVEVGSLA
jgi:hypothetical protein